MKNKITFWLILLAVLSSSFAFSQTNPTNMVGAWQQKDTVGGKVVQFRNSSTSLGITKVVTPATLSDSLKNYAQIQDGLISGGEATLGTGSVTIDTAIYRINKVQYTSIETTFSGITNSPSGTQYYLVVYGEIGSTLDTISGARDTIAIMPTIPVNTVKVNTILVGDGGIVSAVPDLSGYAKLFGGNDFFGTQNFNGNINVYGEQINMLGSTSQLVNRNGESLRLYGSSTSLNLSLNTDGTSDFIDSVSATSFVKNGGTSSQYLMADGSVSTLINNITGTGTRTTNYISKFSSNTNQIENSQIIDNGSNVNIGSTVFSTDKLNVDGTFRANNQINIYGGSAEIISRNASSLDLYSSGSTLSMRLFTNGNIAVGGLSTDEKFEVFGTAKATRLGLGLAASSNHYLTTAANTSTIGSWLWTPSSTDYTGTVSGTFYNNANELKFYDGTISGTNRLLKLFGNSSFVGTGQRVVTTNSVGDAAATTPIVQQFVTDSDIITAITGATYVSNRATITPAGGKTFLQGQLYDDGTFTYIAVANNSVRRW